MDNETTVQNEAEELADETLAAFDEGWDDKDEPGTYDDGQDEGETEAEEPETDSESEETEADADQQEADGNEGGEADETSEGETKGDEGQPDQTTSYPDVPIKYLGNEEVVKGEDVVEYVQKGKDYDRIKPKWDGVKDDIPRLRMYESFLGELAEARGVTGDIKDEIASLIDETRTRTLIARAEAKGEELSPAAAAAIAVKMRTDFVPGMNSDPEEARQEKSQQEVPKFLKEYPDVRAEDIPKEVWDDMKTNDGDLLGSYQRYENKKLKDEIKALKKDLEGAKQQKKNTARSTGSTKSVGSSAGRDAFDEGWDADY